MNPYQHCTRCGEELPDHLKEKYREQHTGGPVLCLGCMRDVVGEVNDALIAPVREFASALTEAFAPLTETSEAQDE